MRKKHLVSLAYALADCRPPVSDVRAYQLWQSLVQAVARVCEQYNTGFERERWFELIACYRPIPGQKRKIDHVYSTDEVLGNRQ